MLQLVANAVGYFHPWVIRHACRKGFWSNLRRKKSHPAGPTHAEIRDEGNRLYVHCMSHGLTRMQADHLRDLFRRMVPHSGIAQAFETCTRRAAELVRV